MAETCLKCMERLWPYLEKHPSLATIWMALAALPISTQRRRPKVMCQGVSFGARNELHPLIAGRENT